MASPPIPPSLEHLVTRPFSFYPPIISVEHNEWLFRKASWSEIQVVNCRSGTEIWIPRRFVGEVAGKRLLRSRKGPTGGFALRVDPSEIRLLDIVEALDGLAPYQQ